jgi:hypothetical protein
MAQDKSLEMLQAEYFQLQTIVEDFDARALTIKAWSVTVSAAALVTAYSQTKPMVLMIAAVSSLAFWVVESLWKLNQQAFYARIYEIENAMSQQNTDLSPFQIATSWSRTWHKQGRGRRVLRILRWPHVFLPHLLVASLAMLLFYFSPPH